MPTRHFEVVRPLFWPKQANGELGGACVDGNRRMENSMGSVLTETGEWGAGEACFGGNWPRWVVCGGASSPMGARSFLLGGCARGCGSGGRAEVLARRPCLMLLAKHGCSLARGDESPLALLRKAHPQPGVPNSRSASPSPTPLRVPLTGPQPHQRPSHRAQLESFATSA